ncbi:hypothetical protein V6N13_027786 [Hibiscus sabdariffa]
MHSWKQKAFACLWREEHKQNWGSVVQRIRSSRDDVLFLVPGNSGRSCRKMVWKRKGKLWLCFLVGRLTDELPTTRMMDCCQHNCENQKWKKKTKTYHGNGSSELEFQTSSYMKEGMRTSVDAILQVQEHNHPHILLLQIGNTFCKFPGGRLKPGENKIEGLKRKLTIKLRANSPALVPDWQIGEVVAIWWRPNFETMMYPYCPPHITKPKECKKLFLVHLFEKEYFAVPKNLKLLDVPLLELYDNVQRYGPVISSIPQQLSRFQFNMIST